ncbi:LuxR C-terminal-related transcriptional regulator [Micromonospora zhanjiangensis]
MIIEGMGLLRGALRAVLSGEDDLEVVADLADCVGILDVVARQRPDVVVVDLDLPDRDMPVVVGRLADHARNVAVLALSAQRSPEALQRALHGGARGFVSKDLPPSELVRAVRLVAAGERVIDPAMAVAALNPPTNPLTAREREVLRAAAEGLPLREIARRLFLAYGTVRNHLSAILRKTGARNRLEAIRRAQRDGWL